MNLETSKAVVTGRIKGLRQPFIVHGHSICIPAQRPDEADEYDVLVRIAFGFKDPKDADEALRQIIDEQELGAKFVRDENRGIAKRQR